MIESCVMFICSVLFSISVFSVTTRQAVQLKKKPMFPLALVQVHGAHRCSGTVDISLSRDAHWDLGL